MTKIAAIICVRMSSDRLPGKPLCVYDPAGKHNLACIIDRVKTSRHSPHIAVATSTKTSDDPIVGWCVKAGVPYVRGDLDNVVSRFDSALAFTCPDAEYVWRVMADNPLVDIGLVDHRIDTLLRYKADVVAPILPEPTYAAQSNIWSREAWDFCARQSSGSLLQHPGEYLYENAGQFKTIYDPGPEADYYQKIRTELDTPEDLEFFKKVFRNAPCREIDGYLNTGAVMSWLSGNPEIVAINAHVQMKTSTTYAHGHARARSWICKDCGHTIAHKVNEGLAVNCQRCGTERRFYP